MVRRVAVLVDGDNISASHADEIHTIAARYGRVDTARVYGDASCNFKWHDVTGFRLVHAGTGKNATDLLLAIDAMDLARRVPFDALVIASSDSDFSHLAQRFRDWGHAVIGVGEEKASHKYRSVCSDFVVLGHELACALPGTVARSKSKASDLDLKIRSIIAADSQKGQGIAIAQLGAQMRAKFNTKISALAEKNWRGYLNARADLYDLDPRGPTAKVRFRPDGFAGAN